MEQDERRFPIGLAAKKANVHPDTLRKWDREGLLITKRNSGGWREYTPEQIDFARRLVRERRRVPVRL